MTHWLLAQQLLPLNQQVAQLTTAVLPAESGVPVNVDARAEVIMGQGFPQLEPGQKWGMSCNSNYAAIQEIRATVAALSEAVTARFAELGPRVALGLSTATQALADVHATDLAVAALQLHEQAQDLHLAALDAQDALQAALTTGNASAIGAATAAAAAAQVRADAAQANATQAINAAASAATQASAAKADTATLAGRIRTKRVATPAMAIGATATLTVMWDTPFLDNAYTMSAPALVGGSLLGLAATVTAHTAAGCTVQIRNTLGLVLLAGAGTLELNALHD